jgi:Phospholipase_D-nuclease N-terminal
MGRVLMVLIPLAITIYAVIDAIQTEDTNVKHLPKLVWVLLILVFTPVGAIAWFLAGRQRGPRTGQSGRSYPAPPRGPDDDPDFLRSL